MTNMEMLLFLVGTVAVMGALPLLFSYWEEVRRLRRIRGPRGSKRIEIKLSSIRCGACHHFVKRGNFCAICGKSLP